MENLLGCKEDLNVCVSNSVFNYVQGIEENLFSQ